MEVSGLVPISGGLQIGTPAGAATRDQGQAANRASSPREVSHRYAADPDGAGSRILRDLLHDYLPELKMEVARTDQRDLRHRLAQREDLAERLLEALDRPQ
jgi:hypothetical protein